MGSGRVSRVGVSRRVEEEQGKGGKGERDGEGGGGTEQHRFCVGDDDGGGGRRRAEREAKRRMAMNQTSTSQRTQFIQDANYRYSHILYVPQKTLIPIALKITIELRHPAL